MKSSRFLSSSVLIASAFILSQNGFTQDPPAPDNGTTTRMEEVVVEGRADDLLGTAISASQGAIGAADLQDRPLLRRGELLETVPGMVITQHSGDGKANQYFLRGFNLDHGTDFSISLDGVPVNLPTHAHGQGYSDLNFLIPELVSSIDYKKGPFYSEIGDFSGAGAAEFHIVDSLTQGILKTELGEHGYLRELIADTINADSGKLTFAAEYNHYDGPWDHPENSNRYNGLLRYVWGNDDDHFVITAGAYHAGWNSTDQVAQSAIKEGVISRFGSLDPSDGGATDRDGLSLDWTHKSDAGTTRLNLYGFYYRLNLFSNFTYFLDDPVHGDQFEQIDKRFVAGGSLTHTWEAEWFGKKVENTAGLQLRNDYIPDVGIDHTQQRALIDVTREDRVEEFSAGLFAKTQVQWTDWFKTIVGLRGDIYSIDVNDILASNSGSSVDGIVSPKLSLIFGPWWKTEFYADLGTGFHSNDARGVTISVDPTTGEKQENVPLLVRTKGAEIGTRTSVVPGLVSTLSLWYLESDSELTFDGDSGDTEANGASRRYGIEWANFYKPTSWLTLDADLALTHARYTDPATTVTNTTGYYIANSIPLVFSAGATVQTPCGIYGSVRLRYFGSQPVIEDDSVRQPASATVNAVLGYRYKNYDFALEMLNAFNSEAPDIEYYYTYRLRGEPVRTGGVIHPSEPREFRASVTWHF